MKFSASLIDGMIDKLNSYHDKTLRQDISNHPENIQALVKKFINAG